MVLFIQLFLTNCVQAHDNCLEVLPHMILYLSTRRPRTIGSPGHVNSQFFKIMYFSESCLSRPGHFSQKSTKNHQKKFAGLRPASPPYGAAPLQPTKVGAKCLATVVLDNQDRAFCLCLRIVQLFLVLKIKASPIVSAYNLSKLGIACKFDLVYQNTKIQNYVIHHISHGASTDCLSASMASSRLVSLRHE